MRRPESDNMYLEDWLTVRGIKYGNVPNKTAPLYNAYRKHAEALSTALGDGGIAILGSVRFLAQLRSMGFQKGIAVSARKHISPSSVIFLNKAIAPKSAI